MAERSITGEGPTCVIVDAKVKATLPERQHRPTLMYVSKDNFLQREDPEQINVRSLEAVREEKEEPLRVAEE
jgi:hypothetical protein